MRVSAGLPFVRRAMLVAVAFLLLAGCSRAPGAPGGTDRAPGTPSGTRPSATATPTEPPGDRVFSTDGTAEVSIPKGALPAGANLADIHVTTVVGSALEPHEIAGDSGVLARVAMIPDGLTFSRPVQISVLVPAEAVRGITLGVHLGARGAEVVPVEVQPGPDGKAERVRLVARVTHFSDVIFWAGAWTGAINVQVAPNPVRATVGDPITLNATITRVSGTVRGSVPLRVSRTGAVEADSLGGYDSNYRSEYTFNTRDGDWDGDISWTLDQAFDIVAMSSPESGKLLFFDRSSAPVRRSGASLQCISEGNATIKVRVRADLMTSGAPVSPTLAVEQPFEERRLAHLARVNIPIECQVPKIVASAAAPLTTYTVSPEVKNATFYAWSGANCGSVTGSTTKTMIWNHGDAGCEHKGAGHPDARIAVHIVGRDAAGKEFSLRCQYFGAETGQGLACTPDK